MSPEALSAYMARMLPARERYAAGQAALEATYASACAAATTRAGRGIRTSGRYWALGNALAALAAAGPIARAAAVLDAGLAELDAAYLAASEETERDVLAEDRDRRGRQPEPGSAARRHPP